MKTLISNFSKQLEEAIIIGTDAKLSPSPDPIQNVLICGLGGSGIGGSIVSELVSQEANIPINVSKGYFIPNYVNKNTLVILSSYSGDTEETLNCMNLAIEKKAKLVCITSGGTLLKTAQSIKFDHIVVPGGKPPRTCLGYTLTQLFFILNFYSITNSNFKDQLKAAVNLIDSEEENIIVKAKNIAQQLKGKTPVIYTTSRNEGIAIRFRQQLNENAKILCWHHTIPEMNHNELVGWTEKNDNISVLIFLDKDEYSRNLTRVEINKKIIQKYTSNITEIYSKGESAIEKAIYFIHLGDWISVLLGELRGVDPIEVNVINQLKSELSNS